MIYRLPIASILLCTIMLSGCILKGGPHLPDQFRNPLAPKAFRMNQPIEGTPDFNLGWKHGCETGISTLATDYYKTFYRYRQDPSKITNVEYYKAWKDGYTYCRQYTFKWSMWTWDGL